MIHPCTFTSEPLGTLQPSRPPNPLCPHLQALTAFAYLAVPAMVLLTLIAAAVGAATMVMGIIHAKQWNSTARSSAVGSNLVTWGLVSKLQRFAVKS
jgi:AWPM-19-like family